MFVPSMSEAVVKINCHNASIRDHSYSSCGNYLVTAAADSSVKVWDLRNTYKEVSEYFSPFQPTSIDISQRDILGIAAKSSAVFFKDWTQHKQAKAYLKHNDIKRRVVTDIKFVPYEDFVGLGLAKGFASITVPGSCKVQFDTFTANVTGNKKQARENAVHRLLEKLPMETIVMNPNLIGKVDPTSRKILDKEMQTDRLEKEVQKIKDQKRRKRSKVKSHKFKEMVRNEVIREQIRSDKHARKVLYNAEKEKTKEEAEVLAESTSKFLQIGNGVFRIWIFLILRKNDSEQALQSG